MDRKINLGTNLILFSFLIQPLSDLTKPFINRHFMTWIVLLTFFSLFLYVFIKNNFYLNKNFIKFNLFYIFSLMLSLLLHPQAVPYSLIEWIVGYSLMLFVVYIITSNLFSEYLFVGKLKKFSKYSIYIAFFLLLLYKNYSGIISYGSVSGALLLPTIFLAIDNILSKQMKMLFLVCTFTLYLFGSRMPLIAGIFTIIFSYFIRYKKEKTLYLCLIFILVITCCFANYYRLEILEKLLDIFSNLDIEMRSLKEIYHNLKDNVSIVDMFLSSGRGDSYILAIDWIKKSKGLPGLFGISRYYSNNQFFFPHNIFLDLTVFFGYILIFPICVYTYIKIKKMRMTKTFKVILLIFFFNFFIRSLTGAYFLGDIQSIFIIISIFFYKNNIKEEE